MWGLTPVISATKRYVGETPRVQGQPRLYNESHIGNLLLSSTSVSLNLQKKKKKTAARTSLIDILQPMLHVWILKVISDLGERHSEASEVM